MKRQLEPGLMAGIDVSLRELKVAYQSLRGETIEIAVENNVNGWRKLAALFGGKRRCSRVVLEATGTFHMDVAIHLAETAGVEIMVVNPLAARRFAEAQMRRAKTDRVDALVLLAFAQRMAFKPWQPPRAAILAFRTVARHLGRLVGERVAVQNQIAAVRATQTTSTFVIDDLVDAVDALGKRIAACEAEALRITASDPELAASHAALDSVPGIADRAAILITAEFAVLDRAMTPDQVIAHAGLDPRPYQSGTIKGARKISKVGNSRLRAAIHLPSITAATHDPSVRAAYEKLLERGKLKPVALTAIGRRLLRVCWVLHKTGGTWNPTLFQPKGAAVDAPTATTSRSFP
jgi:transposase